MATSDFRDLPSVTEVLASPLLQSHAQNSREQLVVAVRGELTSLRDRIKAGESLNGEMALDRIVERVAAQLEQNRIPTLRSVINATGIILHTNLGRAPLAESAARAAYEAGRGYLNLELDLETGQRSSRQDAIRDWLRQLTGAESATAVNNNAAATVIVLRALCQGKEVIVSRGQLVEIGGGFRIPEIMTVSGATLREVGTTNISRIADYENAIGPNTGALLQIHASNFRIEGHTKAVTLPELVELGRARNLPVIADIGSGALFDLSMHGFVDEPNARASVAAGADLVLFSADKLLGGPQAGVIIGREVWIRKIEKDPLMRAFRLDKMTMAALEATLRLYLSEQTFRREIPVWRMLGASLDDLERRANRLVERLRTSPNVTAVAGIEQTFVGGGSLPAQPMPTWVVAIAIDGLDENHLASRLRAGTPAVLGRIHAGRFLLDVRTVFVEQEDALVAAIARLAAP